MGGPAANGVLLTIICTMMFLHGIQGSVLLDSLNCYNDYMTQWRCQWKESKVARSIIPMQLYYWNNLTPRNRQQCVTSERNEQEQSPNLSISCHINSTFSLHMKDNFSLLPGRIIQSEANIRPAYNAHRYWPRASANFVSWSPQDSIKINTPLCVPAIVGSCWGPGRTLGSISYQCFTAYGRRAGVSHHHLLCRIKVRPSPPEGLEVRMSDKESVSLRWKSPLPLHTLLYQISYCQKGWEEWEDSILLSVVDELQVNLSTELLLPGYTYLFRVRARLWEGQQYKGSWSKWSEEIAWEVLEDHEAAPKNVQCEYDGLMKMICSWEVRTEITLSVSYVLYYTEYHDNTTSGTINRTSDAGEQACLPEKRSSVTGTSYVRYSCTMHISPNQANNSFFIQVRPQEELKTFKHRENIKTQPPKILKVEEKSDNGYMVFWDPPTFLFRNIRLSYQLCYWKQGDPDCSADLLVNVSGSLTEYYIMSSDLQDASVYFVRVRARPDTTQAYYRGPWSDWSREMAWKTKKSADSKIIYIVTVVCIIVLLPLMLVGYKCITRAVKSWEDSFPNPSKSKLLSGYPLGYNHSVAIFIRDLHSGEDDPGRHVTQLQLEVIDEEMEKSNEEVPKNPNECPLGPYAVIPKNENKSKCEDSLKDLSGTSVVNMAFEKPLLFSLKQPTNSDYNDPQLLFSHTHALLNIEASKTKNMEYFSLPNCQGEVFGLTKQLNPSIKSVQSKEQMEYVMGMGGKDMPQPSQPTSTSRDSTPLSSPSDLQFATEGPVLVINPDGNGLIMLKQVGDYCLFPGCGSQEKSEMKMAPIKQCMEQHILQDRPLEAIEAFKVTQNGYFMLPQT